MKPAKGLLLWILKRGGFDAITLPPFGIFAKEERMTDPILCKHEMCHWEQWQRMGTIKFYLTYLWYSFRYGYWYNPMEVEARQAQNKP
jgi:hypothetical protein